jgi:hypothetical protein
LGVPEIMFGKEEKIDLNPEKREKKKKKKKKNFYLQSSCLGCQFS